MKTKIQSGRLKWSEVEIEYAACTDPGIVRKSNEDAYLTFADEALFCVADGAGGHANGAMASSLTLDTIKSYLSRREISSQATTVPLDTPIAKMTDGEDNSVVKAAQHANSVIYGENGQNNMVSTLVCCHLQHSAAHITHVGDSRCYLYRDNTLQQLTEDHSLVWSLYRDGSITEEELRNHPRRNIITRAVGVENEVRPEYSRIEFKQGDIFLLCSDGLTSMLPDAEIAKSLGGNYLSLRDVVESLIEQAKQAGGKDNITVVLLRIG